MTKSKKSAPKAVRSDPASAWHVAPRASRPGQPTSTEGLDGAMRALTLALDKKALEPILLDVRSCARSATTSWSSRAGRIGRSTRSRTRISAGLKHEGMRPISTEGARTGQWALLDYGDFVVHVFLHSAREHYDLEGLWNDAPRIPIDVPADARMPEPYESSAVPYASVKIHARVRSVASRSRTSSRPRRSIASGSVRTARSPCTRRKTKPAMVAALPANCHLYVFDERGESMTSAQFAELLAAEAQHGGGAPVAFAIGGADGHSDAVRKRAKQADRVRQADDRAPSRAHPRARAALPRVQDPRAASRTTATSYIALMSYAPRKCV